MDILERDASRLASVAPGMLEGFGLKKASTPLCLIMFSTSVLETSRYPRSGRVLDTVYLRRGHDYGVFISISITCCTLVLAEGLRHIIALLVTHRHCVPSAEDAVVFVPPDGS